MNCFNSKLVRLKVYPGGAVEFGVLCFNSKLVRLKVMHYEYQRRRCEFQFQTGAIKSLWDVRECGVQIIMFQFQTGAIKSGGGLCFHITMWKFQFQTGAIKSYLR